MRSERWSEKPEDVGSLPSLSTTGIGLKPCLAAAPPKEKGKHAGRRLLDAVSEKLEYYSLIRIVCHR